METVSFTPNEEDIEERRKIVPFGSAAGYKTEDPVVVEFVLSKGVKPIQTRETVPQKTVAYRPPAHYGQPQAQLTEYTVRVSNIPFQMSNRDLYTTLLKKCGPCFGRCNLVYDKEKNVSKGVAYVGCSSKEQSLEFAKKARDIVLENFKLCVEILDR